MRTVGGMILMAGISALAASCQPGGSTEGSPSELTRLEREYAYFQSLDPLQQQQLRDLDQLLNDPDVDNRARLERVLHNFNYWLGKLSESDRQSVISEKNWDERLKAIKRIKEREWIETLPKVNRERYAKATPTERIRLVELWREEQKERRDEWLFVRYNWDDIYNENIPAIFQGDKFRKDPKRSSRIWNSN